MSIIRSILENELPDRTETYGVGYVISSFSIHVLSDFEFFSGKHLMKDILTRSKEGIMVFLSPAFAKGIADDFKGPYKRIWKVSYSKAFSLLSADIDGMEVPIGVIAKNVIPIHVVPR